MKTYMVLVELIKLSEFFLHKDWTVNNFKDLFMPPAWKVRRGAWKVRRGHLVIRSSVRPSVCPSICLSVRNSVPLTNKVQYLKFGWWYSNQTWTVASSMGSSHFTDITCPWGWGGVKMLDLEIFAIFWLCCRRGHPCFTNTCLVILCKDTVQPFIVMHNFIGCFI